MGLFRWRKEPATHKTDPRLHVDREPSGLLYRICQKQRDLRSYFD
jgi:hypothetical protein